MKYDTLTSSFLDLRDKLHHIAMRFLQSDEDAKDALQDTWLKLSKKGDVDSSFEARNKLVAVLRNICINRLREKRIVSIDDTEVSRTLHCETEIEDVGRLEELLKANLTPLQRRIYNLVVHEGLEYDEIAILLEMSVEAVRMNMSRTRRKIRETYKALENE